MSPKNKEENSKVRDISIDKIMKASIKLFSEKGYSNTSVNQIAKEAKISKGLIYNYFESKEELLLKIIRYGMNTLFSEEEFMSLFSQPEPKKIFTGIMKAIYEVTIDKSDFLRIYMSIMFQPVILKIVGKEFKDFTDSLFNMMAKVFKDLGYKDPNKESKVFAAMLDGVQLHYLTTENYPLKDVTDFITNKYLKEIENLPKI